MQILAGHLLFSATDLVNFLGCRHATYLDLRDLTNPAEIPERDAATVLIFEKGLEHERRHLASLRARGFAVVEIRGEGFDIAERTSRTQEAMRAGTEVIYQAALVVPPWLGFADFLEKVAEASNFGPWSYEVVDTKLPRRPKPEHVIQLASYSRLIGNEQSRVPARMHVQLGNNERISLRVSDFIHYHSFAQRRLETYVNRPPEVSTGEPCGHCPTCRWRDRCEADWEAADHLTLVANITRRQIRRLREAGISTVRALAALPAGSRLRGIQADTLDRLRQQATLQIAKRDTGENQRDLLPLAPGKGFTRLPRPDPGDIFFDMEAYPFFDDRSNLEYLFGFVTVDGGQPCFAALWAHDRQAEKRVFEEAIDFITARLEQHPDAFVYHYANYEESALKRLAMIYGTRESEVDNLLRRRKLVDLYKVVREATRISESAYSLKNVEVFYAGGRAGDVTTALDSVVFYDRWFQSGDQSLLDQIAQYNEADCRSLLACRDWLVSLRPSDTQWFDGSPVTEADVRALDPERVAKRKAAEERNAALVASLLDGVGEADRQWRELAGHLLDFHRREAKPEYWARFRRQEMTEEDLIDDADCIGRLEPDPTRPPFSEKRSIVYSFRFPPQDFKMRLEDRPDIADTLDPAGEVVRLDEDTFEISIKRGKSRDPLPPTFSLIPSGPIGDDVLRGAIVRFVEAVLEGNEDRFAALTGILRRDYPRFRGVAELGDDADDVARAIDAIGRLDRSHILVQGPPGAGKSYLSARAIVEMLARGNRVGVSSHSHKAIINLLQAVETAASDRGVRFRGIKKSSFEEQFLNGSMIEDTTDNGQAVGNNYDLIAGTAWLFAKELDQQLDYLFVDEAGQVSLANTVAMGVSARNIVLVGDQMQLSQPIKGSHPGQSGLSALQYLLGEAATVPPQRGIFLSKTRRLHPDLCRFISDAFYDGRLLPEAGNERQCLVLDSDADSELAPTGLRFIGIEHEGCSQKSEAEADRIRNLYQSLLSQCWIDREGVTHRIGVKDILVVSPYNMQVNLLRSRLPEGAQVGTVDKFQGQEAAVVLISMATSSGDDLPRQIEFLYSRNRLNVAISRARCLAVIVASPRLLETSCSTIEQMRLVNALCWARNFADGLIIGSERILRVS